MAIRPSADSRAMLPSLSDSVFHFSGTSNLSTGFLVGKGFSAAVTGERKGKAMRAVKRQSVFFMVLELWWGAALGHCGWSAVTVYRRAGDWRMKGGGFASWVKGWAFCTRRGRPAEAAREEIC